MIMREATALAMPKRQSTFVGQRRADERLNEPIQRHLRKSFAIRILAMPAGQGKGRLSPVVTEPKNAACNQCVCFLVRARHPRQPAWRPHLLPISMRQQTCCNQQAAYSMAGRRLGVYAPGAVAGYSVAQAAKGAAQCLHAPPTAMGMLLAAGVHGSAAFGVDEKRME
jgi:hypothetical protein